jgi:exodeoxyribonuclease-5
MIEPVGQQLVALECIEAWGGRSPNFVFAGHAGSGKTSLIPHIENMFYNVIVVTYTNKAALVLRNKGILGAITIHRLMYALEDEKLMTWKKKDFLLDRPQLIIVDEASMVGEKIRKDLESYGIPVLYVGDPFQLPPVKESGSIMDDADFTLTEIHRQAKGSPIIQVATAIREGRRYPDVDQYDLTDEEISSYEVVLCLSNAKRFQLNERIRAFRGFEGRPQVGERVVMAKTDYDLGIYAGEPGTITHVDRYLYRVLFDGQEEDVGMGYCKFLELGDNPYSDDFRGKRCLDFGYAITVHKAQGSQYDSVLYWDERRADARHRYTGATRAVNKLTMAGY